MAEKLPTPSREGRRRRSSTQSEVFLTPIEERKLDPFTVDIKDIATNVKYKMIGIFMEKEGKVDDIFNWKETSDLGDAWFDHNKELRKFAYYGEKPRKLKRPIQDLIKSIFHIQGIIGTAEMELAEAEIQRTIAKHGDRKIEIYNMSAVIAYLSAANGVTVDPDTLTRFLSCSKIRRAGETYKTNRHLIYRSLKSKIDISKTEYLKFSQLISSTLKYLESKPDIGNVPVVRNRKNMVKVNSERKAFLKKFLDRIKDLRKTFDSFGMSFWEIDCVGIDANEYLYDFLLTYIPNLCRLNPQPTGEKPKLEKYV